MLPFEFLFCCLKEDPKYIIARNEGYNYFLYAIHAARMVYHDAHNHIYLKILKLHDHEFTQGFRLRPLYYSSTYRISKFKLYSWVFR